MSEKGMQALARMEFLFLPELKGITLKPYEHCFAGKQHRVAFRTCPPHHAESFLDIVHTGCLFHDRKIPRWSIILCDIH
jgi:hypothetical protein